MPDRERIIESGTTERVPTDVPKNPANRKIVSLFGKLYMWTEVKGKLRLVRPQKEADDATLDE